MDVSQLTDAELRDSLKSHGVSVGPIVATTRKLYEKKLIKLSDGSINNQSNLNDSQFNEDSLIISSSPKKSPPQRVFQNVSAATAAATTSPESDSDDCEESMRYLTEEEMAADRASARQAQSNKGGFLGSTITFTILFVFIAVFAYFLIENAEQLKLVAETNPEDTI
ncbi:Emerin homolog 1 [Caenorhabditis elegans]|uniref:Emerin homolog 1 n=1 Tax=Caenorhabditis elegans TaxID=6239 RepID=EMR1_CAEEL|nr:Emerin homolog 1 [Caenorhabditis elegans]O01971.1 RecName: Full=Emerin homolog 1; AltName: Full=Ce-emerin [Caenorhabditis elegans]CCD67954.1 Emerin homolog 1 [Caenorhabditis elegans]|eukprot:NP_490907.1 Emerin homolog 1 [Caenorhabditis elegans]